MGPAGVPLGWRLQEACDFEHVVPAPCDELANLADKGGSRVVALRRCEVKVEVVVVVVVVVVVARRPRGSCLVVVERLRERPEAHVGGVERAADLPR